MRDDTYDDITEITVDGIPAVRFPNGRIMPLPRGGDGEDTPDTPADAAQAAENATPPAGEDNASTEDAASEGDATEPIEAPDADALVTMSEDDLRTLAGQLADQYAALRQAARTPADAQALRDNYAGQQRIAAEFTRRENEAAQVQAELIELDEQGPVAIPEPMMASSGGVPVRAEDVIRGRQAAGAQSDADRTPPAGVQRPRVALMAAAGLDQIQTGAELDFGSLGSALDRYGRSRTEGKTYLASIPAYEDTPDEPLPAALTHNNTVYRNDELIHEAVSDFEDRVAGRQPSRQGAICEPFDIIREIPDAFESARPVSAVFPGRPSGRLGWQFTPSGHLADVEAGVTLWDEADQAAVNVADAATWKPCVEYECPSGGTANVEFIPACVRYDVTLEMSNPERVRNLNNALNAVRSRVHDARVLQRIDQLSHGRTFYGDYGALPALIEAINTWIAQLTFADRQTPGNYVAIIPPGVSQILTIDRANRAYGTEMETQDVMAYLRGNLDGVRDVVSSLDASLGGEPGLPFHPLGPVGDQNAGHGLNVISGSNYRIRLVDPSAAIYSETGEINAGVMRDSGLIRQNKSAYFTEEGLVLEKHGPQPWGTLDVRLCADGSRAGLVEPLGCVGS